MKKISLFLTAIAVATICSAQAAKIQKSDTVFVRVTNWSAKIMTIGESVWKESGDQIISQLGEQKLRQIKSNYEFNVIPGQMSVFDGKKVKSMEEYSKKMDSLKVMYRIAEFDNIHQGKNWGKRAIIEVPYKGNENWDPGAKWDVVYFILDANAVKIVNPHDTIHVRVTDWGAKSMTIGESVWNNGKDQIISQVGEAKFLQIQKNYAWNDIPGAMSVFDGKKVKSIKEFSSKMDSLKLLYQIARFDHISGDGKNWGKLVIVEAPYKGNEDWDPKVKWDVVYFVLSEKAVKIVGK